MSSHRAARTLHAAAWIALVAIACSVTWAQNQVDLNTLPKIQVTGKVAGIKQGYVEVEPTRIRVTYPKQEPGAKEPPKVDEDVDLNKINHTVAITPKTRLNVDAQATTSYIKPGQYIKFGGKINKQGTVVSPVTAVEIFQPTGKTFQPKIDVQVAFGGFVGNKKEDISRFTAEGRVLAVQRGQVIAIVNAQNARLAFAVADDATVKVAGGALTSASPGDSVTVSGRMVKPGQIVGETVTISLLQKLGEPRSKAAGKSKQAEEPKQEAESKEKAKTE